MSVGDVELAELAGSVLSREANALAALVTSVETGVIRVARRSESNTTSNPPHRGPPVHRTGGPHQGTAAIFPPHDA